MNNTLHVPFFDLRVNDNSFRSELLDAVDRVLKHGRLLLGPEVDEFEKEIAKIINTRFAVGVASGSSALYLALKSIGIGPGDEVITTPLTWIITANAIAECGATPIFVDIREDFNINPFAIEGAITEKTKAIVPVHFTGQMCEMDTICDIANNNNLMVVEDSAQAFSASYKGKMSGTWSKVSSFSMNPMKNLGGYGEAGAIATDDPQIYELVKRLRYAGTKSDPKKIITNECYDISLNHKIDTINAAMLLVAIKHFPMRMQRRKEIAEMYTEQLSGLVKCPSIAEGNVHGYYTYALQVEKRDKLQKYLNKNQIETKIYHDPLINDSPIYSSLKKTETPVARKVLDRFLSIPCHEKMNIEQVEYVISMIKRFYS